MCVLAYFLLCLLFRVCVFGINYVDSHILTMLGNVNNVVFDTTLYFQPFCVHLVQSVRYSKVYRTIFMLVGPVHGPSL